MAGFVKGDIVVIPFPFSDLSGSKRRPAFVLKDLPGDDIILCQITSQQSSDAYAIGLTAAELVNGTLPVASNIRPSRIFTADKKMIIRKAATANSGVIAAVTKTLVNLFS
ncbi:type II toxin-antitoxin system PemK/MazF family toxin [Mucilaginibacter myungsuensis]|uniref:Type II toxin-antitoxin system PemK/MazF family toxin n=1 Tax=Mucilaginibacter myungsuensis TaxID=649104 RepID=A0A929KUL0_9SPHI|nr:type II toxin-antitoxin system PemK/MazF family toxin [Mucilaginibacter myungsuensis]MBE9660703.1 type II toxin-antitoxin system PemK/MazF family toxin [Mucilaginibacter myungsuensis]MDN3600748.1 type II toxin-antitoxin system PemK/MazF family toxin [Mucilaginibacter myungsuensis]